MPLLIFYDYFTPAYKAGGPIRSLDNLVRLIHEEVDIYIYTTSRDHDGTPLDVNVDEWVDFNGMARVFYASKKKQNFQAVAQLIRDVNPGLIYINGVFSLPCVVHPLRAARRRKTPVLISPRGMLQRTSLGLKAFKKKVYLWVLRTMLFPGSDIRWHVTTPQEKDDLIDLLPGASTHLIGNVPHLAEYREISKSKDKIRILTVALVSPMKNHHLVLESMKATSGSIVYDIYGPVKDKLYWEKCKELIAVLPENVEVNYCGEVVPRDVDGLWAKYDFYIQPSKSENFGHAIFEALSAGLPVIISDQTPWRSLEAVKAGWDVSLDNPEALKNAIRRAMSMTDDEYQEWRKGARKLADKYIEEAGLKEKYLEMFNC